MPIQDPFSPGNKQTNTWLK
jgi:hypothetical protein